MVAVIHSSKSLRNALHYNENKVRQKLAKCIHSGNYPKDTNLLGFSDKINRLERLTALNQQTKTNSVHISLNFDCGDKLDEEKLKQIAEQYLRKIGFIEQPFLVYQHNDAGHPHIHIVTTNIKSDGSRNSLHNLGKYKSENARKETEQEFNLVKACRKQKISFELKPVSISKVQYGKVETKQAITNILDHVVPHYKYTSLAELNAVLKQYNIVADRSRENSRIYKTNGLVYRILNSNGKPVGVPIKASTVYNKPTLKNIESNFAKNEAARQQHKRRVMNAVDFLFIKNSKLTIQHLTTALQQENIQVVLRQNETGIIYGITYVDHQTKCVFNGSTLGKNYSANAIQQRCAAMQQTPLEPKETTQHIADKAAESEGFANRIVDLVNDLIKPEEDHMANEPPEQRRFKKRRRKQKHSHN